MQEMLRRRRSQINWLAKSKLNVKLGKLEKLSLPILPTPRPNKREAKREPKISKPKHGETVQNNNRQRILKESLR